jgi:hypothetical protein
MAHYSRLHLAEAVARGGFRELPALAPHEFEWPDGTSPETAGWAGVDAQMSPRAALELALDGERSGHAYYAAVAATTTDAELRAIASEFADGRGRPRARSSKLIAACVDRRSNAPARRRAPSRRPPEEGRVASLPCLPRPLRLALLARPCPGGASGRAPR